MIDDMEESEVITGNDPYLVSTRPKNEKVTMM